MKTKIAILILGLLISGCAGSLSGKKSATGLADYVAGDTQTSTKLNAIIHGVDDNDLRLDTIEAIIGLPFSDGDGTYTDLSAISSTELLLLDGVTGALYEAGGTNVAIADGGTNADDAAGARTNLGLVIGTDVLAPDGDGSSLTGVSGAITDLDDLPGDDTDNNLVDYDILQQICQNPRSAAPGSPFNGQMECADGDNWQPGSTDQGTDDWLVVYRSSDTTWVGLYNVTDGAYIEYPVLLEVANLQDTTTPHVLTINETSGRIISNYATSGADRVFTMPAPHAKGEVIFPISDEFQVDIEPPSGDRFRLNGTSMANDEHIQNTADTLGQRLVGYVVNENGTLRWWFFSSDTDWVEASPP